MAKIVSFYSIDRWRSWIVFVNYWQEKRIVGSRQIRWNLRRGFRAFPGLSWLNKTPKLSKQNGCADENLYNNLFTHFISINRTIPAIVHNYFIIDIQYISIIALYANSAVGQLLSAVSVIMIALFTPYRDMRLPKKNLRSGVGDKSV
jgi:hypothetical protein